MKYRTREEALALSETDRLELAAELLAIAPVQPGAMDLGSAEYTETVTRRLEQVRQGAVQPIPADEAIERLRARAG
ncbi:hypothetical protein [Pendulispora albinea]|uniref:Addiction module component n=1 Tax=Pendulispora albinea TaxID=2741071 RepID=A0ABZ2LL83_9BACT